MSAGPAPLDTLPPIPRHTAPGATTRLAAALDERPVADHWALHLHALDQDTSLTFGSDHGHQITTLDAPLALQFAQGERSLLRLQSATMAHGDTAHAADATRVVRLERASEDTAELIARPLQGSMLLPTAGVRWLAWLLAGRADVHAGEQRWTLTPDQPTWLPVATGNGRLRIDGGGELLLVRLTALPPDMDAPA
jgi:hypothetical protein